MDEHERRAEAAYAAMYEARPWAVKDLYDEARAEFGRAIEAARAAGRESDALRLERRLGDVEAVYASQFRGVGM